MKNKTGYYLITAVLALLLCACDPAEPEPTGAAVTSPLASRAEQDVGVIGERHGLPGEQSGQVGEMPGSSDEQLPEAAPEKQLRTPVEADSLEALVGEYRAEYKALSAEQRAGIVSAWSKNDFHFETPDGIISLYSGSLSREAAAVLMLCNARACVDYVAQTYRGKPEYLTNLQNVFNEAAAKFVALWSEPLTEAEFTSEMLLGLHEIYSNTAAAGDKEAHEGGTTYILWAVEGYGAAQGAADAEAFFAKLDE